MKRESLNGKFKSSAHLPNLCVTEMDLVVGLNISESYRNCQYNSNVVKVWWVGKTVNLTCTLYFLLYGATVPSAMEHASPKECFSCIIVVCTALIFHKILYPKFN